VKLKLGVILCQVILMDKSPVKLDYVEQLDEVWVTCALNDDPKQLDKSKVVVIIRQASSDHPHFASRTQLTEDGLGEVRIEEMRAVC